MAPTEKSPFLSVLMRHSELVLNGGLPNLIGRRPMVHPEFPVIAPKLAPHGGLGGAEFDGHLGQCLGAPEVASKVPLGGHVCCNCRSVRVFHMFTYTSTREAM